MIYFTSDLHFGHKNIISHTGRPFSAAEEMDEALIRNWNRTVQPNDEVYILGDLTMKGPDFAAGIFCKKLVEPVLDTCHIVIRAVGVDGVKVVVDGNIPHAVLWKREVDIQPGQR